MIRVLLGEGWQDKSKVKEGIRLERVCQESHD
jgi:hypothetical protein